MMKEPSAKGYGLTVVLIDGAIYTEFDETPGIRTWRFPYHYFTDVSFRSGMFVVVGKEGNMASSPDGIIWTSRFVHSKKDLKFGTSAIIVPTPWLVSDSDGKCFISDDARLWRVYE